MILKSFAKVNLFLKVLRKRPDGYHEIQTLFERVGLCDKLILTVRRDKSIKVYCSDRRVPRDNSNLCFRGARLLQDEFGVERGADIRIIKRIPVGAGLGGGSGNAAAVLLGLNKLWGVNLARKKLEALAARVGSDVPFFIHEVPFAMGEGRGEKIKPLRKLNRKRLWHVLVVPRIHVSTPEIYKEWDRCMPMRRKYSRLTTPYGNVKILLCELMRKPAIPAAMLFNSLEDITLRLYPQVKKVKSELLALGPYAVMMSGSGPALFAVLSSRREALSLRRSIARSVKSAQLFVVKTF